MSNIIWGRRLWGRHIYAGPVRQAGGGSETTGEDSYVKDGGFTVIAYNPDGTKTAVWGAGSEGDGLKEVKFEITETGCGQIILTFNKLPTAAELNYRQRVDVFLYGSKNPWYSGYIITRPIAGTTETEYKFVGHGYYNMLENAIITGTWENTEISAIVVDIIQQVEELFGASCGITYESSKVRPTGYNAERITLDHVTAKEALKELADFAVDYVYGVDEYRNVYFKPRNDEINEQARFWVGQHVGEYIPSWNVEKIVNKAYIKGGGMDENGEQWLAEVEDADSQTAYGVMAKTWSLPSAYNAADAERWGLSQLERYKGPLKSAKLKNVRLEYPKTDGTFSVRRLSTDGQAAITGTDGEQQTYPITKLKYTVNASNGIKCEIELGEQPFSADKYFADLDRAAKVAEYLQQAANKQLVGN